MNINPTSPNPNIPVTPIVSVNQAATEEVNLKAAKSNTVTAPPATGDTGSHGGSGGQPGLGDHVDVYDTEKLKLAHDSELARVEDAKKKAKLQLLGHEKGMNADDGVKSAPEFPFLIPLGQKKPGQVFDAKI